MRKYYLIVAWFLVIAWMGTIFYLSHQPANTSSELSSGITQIVVGIIETIIPFIEIDLDVWHFLIRKSAHFIAYFLLGIFIVHALIVSRMQVFQSGLLAIIISLLYAISDEIHQLYIPGRSGEVRDVIIDTLGASTGVLLFVLCVLVFERRQQKKRKTDNFIG